MLAGSILLYNGTEKQKYMLHVWNKFLCEVFLKDVSIKMRQMLRYTGCMKN